MRSSISVILFWTSLWIGFFIIQTVVLNEIIVAATAILISFTLIFSAVRGEYYLYFFGVVLGLLIELGLGEISRSQHWENANYLPIPLWLPIIWGYGFVAMRRIGNGIVSIFDVANS